MKKTDSFNDVLDRRFSRRHFLMASSVVAAASLLPGCGQLTRPNINKATTSLTPTSNLHFIELPQGLDEQLAVAEGYESQVLIRWGDPLFSGEDAFNPYQQTAEKQARQFGFNNDFVGFLPLPLDSNNSDHGLLFVNHEYTNPHMMFSNIQSTSELSREQTNIDIMAHGMSVIEVSKKNGQWNVVKDSVYTRRITPHTPMRLSGPAAGHSRLITSHSSDGIKTLGTYGNCAGGVTPWGTVLSGEENIDYMFSGNYEDSSEYENYLRFGMRSKPRKSWSKYYPRWDMNQEPNEPLHAGWIVEVDPYDPNSVPKKRTALGRFKHEGCNVFINPLDQKVIAYSGDDQHFEYLYKFISDKSFQPNHRQANMDLLDTGTLYCARFNDDGSMDWLPLVYGKEPLTSANGFHSQGDVALDTRKAADLLGATPMDRPEDVEVNPVNGKVYLMLTNNAHRKRGQVDRVNPRSTNKAGQIVELLPPGGDHTADRFQWEMLLLAGERNSPSTKYHPATTKNGWLACPDNCAFDNTGNLWIATDGAEKFGIADGIWACAVEGGDRALTKRFLRTPRGAELCGPFFTPDNKNLFCSIQHPGGRSSFDAPSTRWPDFDPSMPPRPAVVVISKNNSGRIGS